MVDETLFDDHDMTPGPERAERRLVRRHVLGGILQVIRARRAWSVNDAASQAGIAPMTWRRLEDGLDVRQRTLTALDGLLGQPFGTVRRALDDDGVMVNLVGLMDLDTPPVDPADAEEFLDGLAERFRTGSVRHVTTSAGAASANLGGLTARVGARGGTPSMSLGGLRVGPAAARDIDAIAAFAAASNVNQSAITIAAQLVEKMVREQMTPAIENAVAAVLAAMPDLVSRAGLQGSVPAVDVLAGSGHPTLQQAAAEVVKQATEEAIEANRKQAAEGEEEQ